MNWLEASEHNFYILVAKMAVKVLQITSPPEQYLGLIWISAGDMGAHGYSELLNTFHTDIQGHRLF